jgi:hypothetical protein
VAFLVPTFDVIPVVVDMTSAVMLNIVVAARWRAGRHAGSWSFSARRLAPARLRVLDRLLLPDKRQWPGAGARAPL